MKNNIELIKSLYQDDLVASDYIDQRFSKPLGCVQHQIQIEIINNAIKNYKAEKILEVACGPARLTKDINIGSINVAIDSSQEMLRIARTSVGNDIKWEFIRTDAFDPGLRQSFQLIYSFRFIRHFKFSGRKKLYKVFDNLLGDKGIAIFDAVHYTKIAFINRMENRGQKKIYDKIYYRRQELESELKSAGYDILELKGVIHHFYLQAMISRISHKLGADKIGQKIIKMLEKIPFGRPLEWIVVCRKRHS